MMLALERDGTVALVDPAHGGEVLDLIWARRRAPARPAAVRAARAAGRRARSQDSWEDRYRGGWQLVAPNTGNASRVGETAHGFHGGASVAGWRVGGRAAWARSSSGSSTAGCATTRLLALRDGALRAETTVHAIGPPVPLVALEHVAGRRLGCSRRRSA